MRLVIMSMTIVCLTLKMRNLPCGCATAAVPGSAATVVMVDISVACDSLNSTWVRAGLLRTNDLSGEIRKPELTR